MANALGFYVPQFYAQEALIQLEKALGMAGRIHRGYDAERRAFGKGDTINIRRPTSFVAGDAPIATPTDLTPDSVSLVLDKWREVKFKLTDKELSLSDEKIISDHIRPAAVALADDIDTKLNELYADIPWQRELAGSTIAVADVVDARKIMFDNLVPVMDEAKMHFQLGGASEAALTQIAAFSQWQGSAQAGVETQRKGQLGQRYGFQFYANQNAPTHVTGAIADAAGTLDSTTVAKGLTTIIVNAVTASSAWKKGDTFVIAGHTQRYAITANVSASGGGAVTLTITPGLAKLYTSGDVVTGNVPSSAKTSVQDIAFHSDWAALAMAPLSDMGNELGAKIATVTDPITGLSLRSRVYYMPNLSEVHVALDVLYGVKTLNPNLAVRVGDFA